MVTYSQKVQSVLNAYELVKATLLGVEGIRCNYIATKRRCHIEVFNDISGGWDMEAILNIYWDQSEDDVFFSLINWPNSNVPFDSINHRLDVDTDGVIEVEDIISVSLELFGELNN